MSAKSPKPAAAPVRGEEATITVYPHGIRVRVAPDQPTVPWPGHLPVQRIGVYELIQELDGRLRPVIHVHGTWVRMRADICEDLGLGISYDSLRRLQRSGFVRARQITPGQIAFDLQSYYQHAAKVQADPEFWTGENLRRYMDAL